MDLRTGYVIILPLAEYQIVCRIPYTVMNVVYLTPAHNEAMYQFPSILLGNHNGELTMIIFNLRWFVVLMTSIAYFMVVSFRCECESVWLRRMRNLTICIA